MALPNFIVIGAQRSGTTWLDTQLRLHPEIYLPQIRKEVHFFDRYYDRGLSWYQRFFPDSGEKDLYRWIGEVTPNYIYEPSAPALIHQHIPNCKFIAILRNPVDRAYSQYGHTVRNKAYKATFTEYLKQNLEPFQRGLYSEQIKRYLQYFPLQNFLILIFEETMQNPEKSLKKIFDFLNLDFIELNEVNAGAKINQSYQVRFARSYALARDLVMWLKKNDLDWLFDTAKAFGLSKKIFGSRGHLPSIDTKMYRELLLKYEPDIDNLEKILQRDLSIWKNS
jgi:hypothetical protein